MKILHVLASLDPALGGPPAVAMAVASAQATSRFPGKASAEAAVHKASILSVTPPEARSAVDEAYGDVPGSAQVRRVWIETPATFLTALCGGATEQIAAEVAASDVLHLHGVWEPWLLHAANAARRLGKPYLVTPHGMLDEWSLSQKRLKKRVALALTHRRMLNSAAVLQMLNADEERYISPLGLTASKQVVPNGVFLEDVDAPVKKSDVAEVVPACGGKPYVLFLSRLHYKKGLDYLAEAFRTVAEKNADAQLVVTGPDGGARQEFESQVADLDIADRVHVTGPQYGDAKRALLRGAACFCLPSRQEGFSMAITEAMAYRVPVVISEACHFPEVAEVGAGSVVATGDAAATSDALLGVLSDPEAAAQQAAAGRLLVEQRYTWNRIADRFLALYEQMIDRG
ncbi:MAG: glycosyltransferase [Planctomycetota bacterium]